VSEVQAAVLARWQRFIEDFVRNTRTMVKARTGPTQSSQWMTPELSENDRSAGEADTARRCGVDATRRIRGSSVM